MPHFPSFEHWFPPSAPPKRRPAPAYTLRHPTEENLAALEGRLRDWMEQHGSMGPGRAWPRNVAGSSWLAEADPAEADPAEADPAEADPAEADPAEAGEPGAAQAGRPLGILLGLASPHAAGEASIQRIAVDPEFRRRGIGRALVDRFSDAQERTGASRLTASCRPDDRPSLAFFAALGFRPNAGPGSRKLYGVPAFEDWECRGEDRVLLERPISP
jgi:ribosomal protein S18 acetylase RimI-like enzyme